MMVGSFWNEFDVFLGISVNMNKILCCSLLFVGKF